MSKKKKRSKSRGKSKKFQYKRPQVAAPQAIDEEFAGAQQAKADEKQRKAEEALIEKAKAVQRELEAAEASRRKAEAAASEESKDETAVAASEESKKARTNAAESEDSTADEAEAEKRKAKERQAKERQAKERQAKERQAKERRAKERRAKDSRREEEEVADSFPSPPSFWRRNDLSVLLFALVVFVGGAFLTRHLAAPKRIHFDNSGLHFERPTGWLPAQQTNSKAAGLAGTTSGFGVKDKAPAQDQEVVHIVYQSARDSRLRIEVHIGPRPAYRNLRGARAIERLGQYGEFYWEAESGDQSIARRDWVRSQFRYAFKASKSGSPQIANAVEYATIQDKRLYVVTLHGESESMQNLDNLIAPTLRIGHAAPGASGAQEAVSQ